MALDKTQLTYKIIDDYLPPDQYKIVYDYMTGERVEWSFIKYITSSEITDEGMMMCNVISHTRFGLKDPDKIYRLLLTKINPIAVLRIKANLTFKTPEPKRSSLHVDYEFPCVTAIYYINTNNGYTYFEDGTKIDSVGNRMLIFPSHQYHGGCTTTDQPFRMVCNFNYHPS